MWLGRVSRRALSAAVVVGELCSLAERAEGGDPKTDRYAVVDSEEEEQATDRSSALSPAAMGRLTPLEVPAAGDLVLRSMQGSGAVRVFADGARVSLGAVIPRKAKRIGIQGTRPGRVEVDLGAVSFSIHVIGLRALDATGKGIDFASSHASIERVPPAKAPPTAELDPDAQRFMLLGASGDLPKMVSILSTTSSGAELDHLDDIPLVDMPCPEGVLLDVLCRSTPLIRAVGDDVDRTHPLVAERSILAEVGGTLTVATALGKLRTMEVGGPRHTPAGPIGRLRGHLRVIMVRERPKGPPPFGGDDAAALALARRQLAWTNAIWGQCGVHFGAAAEAEVRLVDPPPPHLLSLGCDLGLPASGGELHFRVDGREVRAELRAGMTPRVAARATTRAIEAAGFSARLSENARIEPGAAGSADVLVKRRDGQLATIELPGDGKLSSDATMTACIGQVDFADGLSHFSDADAPAGTLEERTLIKAFDDGDPSTIEVLMVPAFAGGGRIGESFIFADRSSVRNVVIEDRAGVRADRASFALAHELGHILLDMPGHPDDFGVDNPTLLMDSDAADPTAFGPRRLTLSDCARVVRQSGPGAPAPVVVEWPLPMQRAKLPAATGR